MRKMNRQEWIVVGLCLFVFIAGIVNFAVGHNRAARATIVNACRYILSRIDAACADVSGRLALPAGADIPRDAVIESLKGHVMPECPSGGQYALPKLGGKPTCSVHGDLLNEKTE
jgi:hypothetical protein